MTDASMKRRQFLSRITPRSFEANSPKTFPSAKSVTPLRTKSSTSFKTDGIQSVLDAYTGEWTEKEAIHLLRRITFGAKKADVDLIKAMSVSDAVDFLIDNPVQPSTTPVNNYTQGTDSGGVAFGSSWIDAGLPDPPDDVVSALDGNRIYNSFKPWWMGQMINQRTHILEKMTLFWANHFGTSTVYDSKSIFQHHRMLRANSLGNFRMLLKLVTLDPHMLFFLNGSDSSIPSPNENYARELQELFTIGKGPDSHYTEDDVKAASKVLSGWHAGRNPSDSTSYTYYTYWQHDITDKQFSAFYNNTVITGQTGSDGGSTEIDMLIDMILKTDECAKYLVRRFYRWFVYSEITADIEANVITPLAAIFRVSNYDIPTVLKALFKSEHFYDAAYYGGIIKSPVDLYVSMIREFNLTLAASPVDMQYAHWKSFTDKCANELQDIGDPPNVSGWPAYWNDGANFYQVWMSNASIQVKARNLYNFVNTGVTLNGVTLKIDAIAFNKQFDSADQAVADKVVANFVRYLLPMDLTDDQVKYLKTALVPDGEKDPPYWNNRWNTYLSTPTNLSNTTDVQGMLTQLIYRITCLAEYFLY